MVGSLSAGLLLADEAGAHLPSVDDFLPPEILFQGTPFAINRIILIRIVATIVLLVVLGVTAKRAKLIPGRWQGVVEYGLDFVRDKVVYDVMGEARGKRYVPMITTLFFTIFIFNLCGIIPGMNMAANATVVMPLVFAVWTLIQYWIAAIRSTNASKQVMAKPPANHSAPTGMPCSLLTASTIQNCANARQVATIRWPETMLANRRMVREAGRMINSSSRLIGASRK